MKTMKSLGFTDEEIAIMKKKGALEMRAMRARLAELGDKAPKKGIIPGVVYPDHSKVEFKISKAKRRAPVKQNPPSRKTAEK